MFRRYLCSFSFPTVSGGTGFDKDTWRRIAKEYIAKNSSGKYVELDCPHYVHDYEYEAISRQIKEFLSE